MRRSIPVPRIAIKAAKDAGSSRKQDVEGPAIGSLKTSGNQFNGEITILTIQAKSVRIIGQANHRLRSRLPRLPWARDIGAAWTKRSKEDRSYPSVLLDKPSLVASFYLGLISDDESGDQSLNWSRASQRDRD